MLSESTAERFEFAFDRRLARPLSLLGIRPDTSHLMLDSSRLEIRFGPWTVRTTLDNVAGTEITGPYSAWKVIGARMSMVDRGLTFGTSTEQGVCIRFHQPVRGLEPTGLLRHPGLTLTVADPSTVARRLQEVAAAAR
ncbi:hypothetical protein [Actinomadura sp. NAK00032]|uniref:hypothetical protein n=1 Tax=Actinomadura sp. NAK00032 TaxID=2742128 RepID=UPI001C379F14|nr:hypothetical protein [Actinomadura sp. NAK00032]